ncbi:MAG: MFS transporter [Acidimicrobiales bacterium]|nr:MFS transporter [Acidimicrobiales bacterium]RZV48143.1 MAG: MFS transporter [Acidimicrobiales bacterium]
MTEGAVSDTTPRNAIRFVLAAWTGFTVLIATLIVLIPLRMVELGFGIDSISAVVAAAGVGGFLSAEAIGRAAGRFGAVRLLRAGLVTMGISVLLIGVFEGLAPLLILHATVGVATSAIRVGSQLVVRNRVAETHRGRVHGLQGATNRTMMLVAPVLVGIAWERLRPQWSFALPVIVSAALLLAAGRLSVQPVAQQRSGGAGMPLARMARYSMGPILFNAARAGRMLLLPLFGLELDLSASQIGLLIGLTSATDVLVSPISGLVMDRRGRMATIIPTFTLMASGFVVLAVADSAWVVAIAAAVLGLGNGFSAGLLLTIGTDLAPTGFEGPFLGRFGALSDIGRLVGPFLVGVLGESLGLSVAAIVLAGVTVAGLAAMIILIGETRPGGEPSTIHAH